jgi:hypothetical protein
LSGLWLTSYLLLWAFVVLQGVVVIALLRAFTGLHQRIEEQQGAQGIARLAPGAVLADEAFTDLSGYRIELSRLWQKGKLLLLFASVDCTPCRSLLTWVGDAFRNGQLSDSDVCVLCAGQESQVQKFVEELRFPSEVPVATIAHASLRSRYHISGTPTLAVVDEHGQVVDVVVGEIIPYLEILSRRSTFRIPI